MKNLENYGVQELNAREIQETDGGCPWCVVVGTVLAVSQIYDEIVDGIEWYENNARKY